MLLFINRLITINRVKQSNSKLSVHSNNNISQLLFYGSPLIMINRFEQSSFKLFVHSNSNINRLLSQQSIDHTQNPRQPSQTSILGFYDSLVGYYSQHSTNISILTFTRLKYHFI